MSCPRKQASRYKVPRAQSHRKRTVDVFDGPYSAALPGNPPGAIALMRTRLPARLEADGGVLLVARSRTR